MSTIIFTTIAIAVGAIMFIKTPWFVNSFGRSAWAEANLGSGGTYNLYKILGMVIIVASLMWATGLMQNLILSIFGSALGGLA